MVAKYAIHRLENFMERFNKETSMYGKCRLTILFVRHELPLIIEELWKLEEIASKKEE